MISEQPGRQEVEAKKSAFSLDDLLKILSLLVGISWLFFALGWFYLYGFYGSFRLDVQTLELPFYYPILNSMFPLAKLAKLLLPLSCVLVGFGFVWVLDQRASAWLANLLRRFITLGAKLHKPAVRKLRTPSSFPTQQEEERFHRFTHWMLIGIEILIVLFLFLQCLNKAIETGFEAGKNVHSCNTAQPWTKVNLRFKKDEENLFDAQLKTANAEETLALLIQTKELLVVFSTSDNHANSGVFVIPRSNLLSVSLIGDIPCTKVNSPP